MNPNSLFFNRNATNDKEQARSVALVSMLLGGW